MFCQACGSTNDPAARFCNRCGAGIVHAIPRSSSPEPSPKEMATIVAKPRAAEAPAERISVATMVASPAARLRQAEEGPPDEEAEVTVVEYGPSGRAGERPGASTAVQRPRAAQGAAPVGPGTVVAKPGGATPVGHRAADLLPRPEPAASSAKVKKASPQPFEDARPDGVPYHYPAMVAQGSDTLANAPSPFRSGAGLSAVGLKTPRARWMGLSTAVAILIVSAVVAIVVLSGGDPEPASVARAPEPEGAVGAPAAAVAEPPAAAAAAPDPSAEPPPGAEMPAEVQAETPEPSDEPGGRRRRRGQAASEEPESGAEDPEAAAHRERVLFAARYQAATARSCFQSAGVSGTVTVRVTVAPDGSVSAARPGRNTTGNEAVGRCVAERVSGWRLPPPPNGPARVNIPVSG